VKEAPSLTLQAETTKTDYNVISNNPEESELQKE
jgi:hypothetical protein